MRNLLFIDKSQVVAKNTASSINNKVNDIK